MHTDYGTSAIPTLLWIGMAAFGMIVSGWSFVDAFADWRLERLHNIATVDEGDTVTNIDEAYHRTTRRDVINEACWFIAQGVALVTGLYVLQNLTPPHVSMSRPGIYISGGIIWLELTAIGVSMHNRHVRHEVIRILLTAVTKRSTSNVSG